MRAFDSSVERFPRRQPLPLGVVCISIQLCSKCLLELSRPHNNMALASVS